MDKESPVKKTLLIKSVFGLVSESVDLRPTASMPGDYARLLGNTTDFAYFTTNSMDLRPTSSYLRPTASMPDLIFTPKEKPHGK